MSYADYSKGLMLLDGKLTPKTYGDMKLARVTLVSLYSAWVGSGSNTHIQARERYRAAQDRFRVLRKKFPGDLDAYPSHATLEVSGTTPEESEHSE